MLACPETLWSEPLWSDCSDQALPPESAAFWYLTYHTLFWLDLNLSGSLEGFAPPGPFTLDELDPAGVLPERPYTKDELHAYLRYARRTCQTTIAAPARPDGHQPDRTVATRCSATSF